MYLNFALFVNDFYPTTTTQIYLQEIYSKPQYNVTIFSLSKENSVGCGLPVFSIVDAFNWKQPVIITSMQTLEKYIKYPILGIGIILGNFKHEKCLNIDRFDLDEINKLLTNKKDVDGQKTN